MPMSVDPGGVGSALFRYMCWGGSSFVFLVIAFTCLGAWINQPNPVQVITTETNSTLVAKRVIEFNNYQVQLDMNFGIQTSIRCQLLSPQYMNYQDAMTAYGKYNVGQSMNIYYYYDGNANTFICVFNLIQYQPNKNSGSLFITMVVFFILGGLALIGLIRFHCKAR